MARLVIEVKGDQAERALKSLNAEAAKLGGTVKRMDSRVRASDKSLKQMKTTGAALSGVMKNLGLVMGAAGLTAILRGSTRAAIEQAQAEAQLRQGIISTGGAAKQSAEGLIEMAAGLQRMTTFGDEAIIRAESILLTFTKISGETFPATVKATLDLAARMGTDLSGAAVQLGKALNDPVANLGELGRAGIQFSKEQKTVIKTLFETNRVAEAQAIILEELTRQFGGSAEAAAKAAGGGYKQLGNALGDITEGVGAAFLPMLDGWGRGLAKVGTDLKAVAGWLTALIVPGLAFNKIIDTFGKKADAAEKPVGKLIEASERFTPAAVDATGAVTELEAQLALLNATQAVSIERFEDTIDVIEEATPALNTYLAALEKLIETQKIADSADFLPVGDFLPDQLEPLETGVTDAIEDGAAAVDWSSLGSSLQFAIGDALFQALSDPSNFDAQGFATQLAGIAGNAIGGPILGGLLAGAVAGFGSDNAAEAAREQQRIMEESQRRMEELISATLPALVNQVEQVFDDYRGLILTTGEAAETGALALEQLRDAIFGISTTLVDSLQAAILFNQKAQELANSGRTTKFGTEIEGAEIELINLGELAGQLAQQFAGVSFEFRNVLATSQALQDEIRNLGLSELQTAQLLAQVAEAERIRMTQLETDVLQRLVNVLAQIPGMEQAAAELQQQINQARFQIEVKLIEMQLSAMGLMTVAFQEMLAVAVQFGNQIENFRVPNINIPNINIPHLPGLPGIPSGPSGPTGPTDAERLIETLERLASTTAFRTLNDRLRDLKDEFFGPDGFAAQARELGVDMALVNQAFAAQHRALMAEANRGIIQFLGSLGTSALNPGGIAAQFGAAQASFMDLFTRANQGDLDARSQLGGAGQTYLQLARERFGNTRRFREIFEQVQGQLGGLVGKSFEEQQLSNGQRQIELLEIIAGVRPSSGNLYSFASEQIKQAVDRQTEVLVQQHQAEVSATAKGNADRQKAFTDLIEAVDDAKLTDAVVRPRAVGKM